MLYEVLEWGAEVGEGVTQARYCTLEGVAKGSSAAHAYVVANEAACMRLALALGLPTPPGIVTVADEGEPYYVSLRFGPKGSRPPPVIPEHVVEDNAYMASGVIVFDAWVANTDRNPKNLAYARGRVPLAIFDHGHALLGGGCAGTGVERFRRRRDLAGVEQHCLVPALGRSEHLMGWCERVTGVPDRLVHEICTHAAREAKLERTEAEAAVDFLLYRKARMKELLESAREPFRSLDPWSLL